MWALEYHCGWCKPTHEGRFFKEPDAEDLARSARASQCLTKERDLPIPPDMVPAGDETTCLHRWGYHRYREMFNDRQLLGLGLLLSRIRRVPSDDVRHALLTVFSDFLRYQNLLCRYDTYALKCQDIFSVHGFPVGLVQCENNVLGIPRIGSGAFRHFVEKYVRAKKYCVTPYEIRLEGRRKQVVPIPGESIGAQPVMEFPSLEDERQAWLVAAPATSLPLPTACLDGVFTDPPYFDNVQYAELMDFCYVWLRLALGEEFVEFRRESTRNAEELTGNATLGRGLEHFTGGLSAVFQHYAAALKPTAPFVFTYHHNDPTAYVPLVVAILDAGLACTAMLPAAAEMGASLHISGTASSVLDTVFVCRSRPSVSAPSVHQRPGYGEIEMPLEDLGASLFRDAAAMRAAGLRVTAGDVRCLAAGHLARAAVTRLRPSWDINASLPARMACAGTTLTELTRNLKIAELVSQTLASLTDDA